MELGIIGYLLGCCLAGGIAAEKHRSFFGFFFLSLLLTPLFGVIAAACSQKDTAAAEAADIKRGAARKCPYCAEVIRSEATICRFCGRNVR